MATFNFVMHETKKPITKHSYMYKCEVIHANTYKQAELKRKANRLFAKHKEANSHD